MYYWIPEEHCVYQGVHKLPPGCFLQVGRDGRQRLERYYDPATELAAPSGRRVDVEGLREVLEDSIAAHLVADVPISTFLSGGLDSSLITVLATRHNRDIDSYTISFRPEDRRFEAMPDDLSYARKLADTHGIRLHEVEIAPDVADLLPRLVHSLDEPIGDAAAINAYLICRAARDAGVKVLLSGMGADELFGGYRKHYANLLASRYRRLPGVVRHRVVSPAVRRLPVAGRRRGYRSVRWAQRFVAFADQPEEAAFRRSYTHYDVGDLQELLDPELWPAVDQLVAEHAAVYAEGPADDQVNRMCYTDTRMFLAGLNLAYTDRASMAASTEVRVPYVDKEVAAAAFAIPGSAKIAGRERKAILKKAAEAWLPKEVVYRPKGLFSAPLRAWIRRDLSEMVEDLVAGGNLVTSGMVDKQVVRGMIDDDRRGAADRSKEIWQLLTLEVWYRQQRGG
jgi:asparagine synthase (glutamine-hydrolysing)